MSKWRIELHKIGRGKITRSVDIESQTLEGAEAKAIQECRKHLRSNDVDLCDKLDLTYSVCAGFYTVGQIKIISI